MSSTHATRRRSVKKRAAVCVFWMLCCSAWWLIIGRSSVGCESRSPLTGDESGLRHHVDGRTVHEQGGAAHDDPLALLQAGEHRDGVSVHFTELDAPFADDLGLALVLDDEH